MSSVAGEESGAPSDPMPVICQFRIDGPGLLDQLMVQFLMGFNSELIVVLLGQRQTCPAHLSYPALIAEQDSDSPPKTLGITGLGQESVNTIVDDLWNAGGADCDNGQAACCSFQQDHSLGLDLGGCDEETGYSIKLRQTLPGRDKPGKVDAVGDPQGFAELHQGRSAETIAHDQQMSVILLQGLGRGLDDSF